jgi:DNA-binding CsgD family transcriptional regulator
MSSPVDARTGRRRRPWADSQFAATPRETSYRDRVVQRLAGRRSLVADAPLRGRDPEIDVLARLLDQARSGTAARLAVAGRAGQGKTRLLDLTRDRARAGGFTVAATVGREVHQDLVFAGLSGVLRPLLGLLDEVPRSQADVLRGALGLEEHPASALAVANATLTLLARAAEDRPVLVVVDDAHWVDRSSLSTLLFVAHQVEAERVALVFGCRPGGSDQLAQADLPAIELTDLDAASAVRLLVDQHAPVEVARRCWQLAGGNPLALLEGFSGLTPAQQAGQDEMPPILPMGDRLLEAFTQQLGHLPPATATALAVAAVDTSGELGVVTRAVVAAGARVEDLLAAETAGIVDIERNRLTWRHPLLRAAVHLGTSPQLTRAAHRALAETLPATPSAPSGGGSGQTAPSGGGSGPTDERRLAHLAESILGQDEAVAASLTEAAGSATRRGALSAAAALHTHAADLSPDDGAAHVRALRAAVCHLGAGELEAVTRQLRPRLDGAEDPRRAGEVAEVLGQAEMWLHGPAAAVRLFEHHAAAVRGAAPRLSATLHLRAAVACLVSLDAARATRAAAAALAAARESGDMDATMGAWAVQTLVATFAGDIAEPAASIATLEQVVAVAVDGLERAQTEGVDAVAQLCAYALIIHDRPEPALRALDRILRYSHDSGRTGLGLMTRILRAEAMWRQGRWNEALAEISLAITVQEASGLRDLVPLAQAVAARVLAGLGRAEECEDHVAAALAMGTAIGVDLSVVWAQSARGLVHLGAGRFERAAETLEGVVARAGHARQPGWLWWQADLIEALHATGRRTEALATLRSLEAVTTGGTATWASGAVQRSRALLGAGPPGRDPEEDYAGALDTFTAIGVPFEQARTLLLRGVHRIAAGAGPAGYRDLAEARTVFDRLGARDWAERASRARDEQHPGGVSLTSRLTKKELPVALLVGRGATDRAVADELFISTKTVGYHLGNIYAKLGIRNRTQLAALLAAEQANAEN